MFAYCMNNPVNIDDPMGQWPRWITAVVAVVAVVVAVAVPVLAPIATKVAIAATATLVAQTIHYDVRQSKNSNLPSTAQTANNAGWRNSKKQDPVTNPNGGGPAADLHQYSAPKPRDKKTENVKYVSPDGKREVIYDFEGNMVTDPRDIGTYNFVPSGSFWGDKGHGLFDVVPWVLFGNSDDDWGPLINIFTD
jgi:type II secretory pathway pseudopilin PulG